MKPAHAIQGVWNRDKRQWLSQRRERGRAGRGAGAALRTRPERRLPLTFVEAWDQLVHDVLHGSVMAGGESTVSRVSQEGQFWHSCTFPTNFTTTNLEVWLNFASNLHLKNVYGSKGFT